MATDVPLILVSGASGYVASWLIKELLEKGEYRVRGTVRDKNKQNKIQPLLDLVPDAKYPLELVEAELGDASSWGPAVQGCMYVFHVASPFPPPTQSIRDENVLIGPAVAGAVNVLTACAESGGSVKRVVLTSSVAAVSSGMNGNPGRSDGYVYTEEDWSDESTCPPYEKSKLRAERAAWEFVEKLEDDKKFELVVVNPGYIQGPLLSAASGAGTLSLPVNLLEHKIPGLLNTTFSVVDVRDVVASEMAAMFTPAAAGKRFILSGYSVTMKEFALIVKNEFQPQGYNIPSMNIPKFVLWGAKFFDPSVKALYPGVNRKLVWSNERMVSELGVQPRPLEQTLIETCYNIIELGLVRKTPGYLGPPDKRQQSANQPESAVDPPEATTEQPTSDANQPESTTEQPEATTEQPADVEQPEATTEQTADVEQPESTTEQTADVEQPETTTEQTVEQPEATTEQPAQEQQENDEEPKPSDGEYTN